MKNFQVIKRNGDKEDVSYDKITQRLQLLIEQKPALSDHINAAKIVQKVVSGIYDSIETAQIDELAAEICASSITHHPDYGKLASRITVSNLHKNTPNSFLDAMKICYDNVNPRTDKHAPQVTKELIKLVRRHNKTLEKAIEYEKDYTYSYFGMKTLSRAYLKRAWKQGKEVLIERPQHMLMRVSLGIWGNNIEMVLKTYQMMSDKRYTHATPTLFNAGTYQPQLSSCFLIANEEDSLDGIMNTYHDTARISAKAGGIGLSMHDIRAKGSYISGSGGTSNGIMPYLRNLNELSRYWDQGGGKRKGSFAIYIEPWHADIFTFLDVKKNHGAEEMRARDLFPALWIPDLFMKRVKEDSSWTLMCPNECPRLYEVHGEEFEELYLKYESEGKGRETIPARKLWEKITESQIETGTPYMLYKDACNIKSNQKNLGTIRSSNLCTEIVEFSNHEETAVCNLASISLTMCVAEIDGKYYFDHEKLREVTSHATRSLNKVIDVNQYPTVKTLKSNMRHRPLGLGVQGLADVFALLRYPFDGEAARKLNYEIFETMYFASLETSCLLAQEEGKYESYEGSPISEGLLQYDLWDQTEMVENKSQWDWYTLKADIAKHGVRNSLLMAPMPTASTSQILGNNEAFEPFNSNIYTRRTLSGEFIVMNEYLLKDLIEMGVWTEEFRNEFIRANGSVQAVEGLSEEFKLLYRSAYEMSMVPIIDMAADRGLFIDQSQSMNVFMTSANHAKLTSMHFYAWEKGLKTGMYYLRTKAAVQPIQFTVTKKEDGAIDKEEYAKMIEQSREADDDCLMCGS